MLDLELGSTCFLDVLQELSTAVIHLTSSPEIEQVNDHGDGKCR